MSTVAFLSVAVLLLAVTLLLALVVDEPDDDRATTPVHQAERQMDRIVQKAFREMLDEARHRQHS